MRHSPIKKQLLTQTVLASTLFMTPAFATYVPATPNTTANGPIFTSTQPDNIVEVPSTGQIKGTAPLNAVELDSMGGMVIVDAVNTYKGVDAITATGAGVSIAVNITKSGGSVIVGGDGSGISDNATLPGSDTILVGGSNTTITNAGTIANNKYSAIHILAAGSNTTINNQVGANIQNSKTVTLAPVLFYDTLSSDLTINNAGFITGQSSVGSNQDTIQTKSSFIALNNLANGTIQQISGGVDTGNTINVIGPGVNTINNNLNAQIINTSTKGAAIVINGMSTGALTNNGFISTNNNAIVLNANLADLINTGVIQSSNPTNATIYAGTNGIFLAGGLRNSGMITNQVAGGAAIDFQTIGGVQATVYQNGGTINGNVLLADSDSTGGNRVFFMTGGVVGGNVIGASAQGNAFTVSGGTLTGNLVGNGQNTPNTFTLSGGTINGQVQLGTVGDTVTLSGTKASDIVGNTGKDTFNVSGGSFTSLTGGGNLDVLNILGTFVANGFISEVPTITVQGNNTVFTANAPITSFNNPFSLTIDPNSTFIPNNLIAGNTGTITNNGTILVTDSPLFDFHNTLLLPNNNLVLTNNNALTLGRTAVLTINSGTASPAVIDTPSSSLNIQVGGVSVPNGSTTAGKIVVNSTQPDVVTLATKSFIAPQVSGFIPKNAVYNIIQVNSGGTISDNSTLVQPPSATVTFTKSLINNDTILQLTASRNSYISLSSTGVTNGIASTLDALATGNGPDNQNLLNLLAQLDLLTSNIDVQVAIESLAPFYNYSLIEASYLGMNSVFNTVHQRIEETCMMRRFAQKGQNFGDPLGSYGVWGELLAASTQQNAISGIDGYRVDAGGLVFGSDWGVSDAISLGFAGSFVRADIDDKNINPKEANVDSWQATAYTWVEFNYNLYLDAIIALAHNQYETNRVISVNEFTTAARASFAGTQWGALVDLGWLAFRQNNYYVSPFARVELLHLALQGYEENGALDFNLSIASSDLEEILGGIGIKMGWLVPVNRTLFVPEISAFLGYDFENKAEHTTATLLGGGPAFVTEGVKPGRWMFDLNLGLNSHLDQNNIFTVKYNVEVRNRFFSNAGMVLYNFYW